MLDSVLVRPWWARTAPVLLACTLLVLLLAAQHSVGFTSSPTPCLTASPDETCASAGADEAAKTGGTSPWLTIANGDDVRSLTRIGESIWAGAQAGGAIRWDGPGRYRQYLYPQDGLAANDVRDIVAHLGRVWFATSRGLSVLSPSDGAWTTYTTAHGLPSNDVTALASGPDGSLWIGTRQVWTGQAWTGGGLARLRDGQWQLFTPADNLASLNITDLTIDSSGRVWATGVPYRVWVPPADPAPGFWQANGGGASVFDGAAWTVYQRNDENPSGLPATNAFYAATADGVGNVWFATAAGLHKAGPTGWLHWTVTGGSATANPVTSLTLTTDGRVWLAVTDPGGVGLALSVLDLHATPNDTSDDTWRHFPTSTLPGPTVNVVLGEGADVWAGLQERSGNGAGLVRLEPDGALAEHRVTYGLSSNYISALSLAPDGALWIGTGGVESLGRGRGLHILGPDGSWSHHRAESRATQPATRLTRTARRGEAIIYVNWTDEPTARAALASGAFFLDTDPTRYTFNGFYSQGSEGLLLLTPALTQDLPVGAPLYPVELTVASDNISGIAFAPDGATWIASRGDRLTPGQTAFADGGLSRYRRHATNAQQAEWTIHRASQAGLPSNDVSAVAVGPDGRVWTGTGSLRDSTGLGMAVLNPSTGEWTRYTARDGLPSDNITGIVAAPEGDIWVSAAPYWTGGQRVGGGVAMLRGGSWTVWTPGASRLVADYSDVRAIGRDRRGGIWAGSWHYEGPSLFNDWPAVAASVNRFAGGEWANWLFSRDGWVSAVASAPDGKLWLGVSRGGHEPDISTGGLWVWDRNAWVRVDTSLGLTDNDIQALAIAADGAVWVGAVDHGLSRYSPAGAPLPTPVLPTLTPTRTRTPTATPTRTPTPTITTTAGPRTPRLWLPYVAVGQALAAPYPTSTVVAGASATPRPTSIFSPTASATPPPATPSPTAAATTVPPGQWTVETSGGPTLRAVAFLNAAEGWAVGDNGTMLHYRGDRTPAWTAIASPTTATLRAIAFHPQSLISNLHSPVSTLPLGWAVGDGGVVLAYLNGAWQVWAGDLLPAKDWRAVALADNGTGWMISSDSVFARLAGGHWSIDALSPGNVEGARAMALTSDGRFGAVVGDLGRAAIWRGAYWDTPGSPVSQHLYAVGVLPDGQTWAAGEYPALMRYPVQACGQRPAPCWSAEEAPPHLGGTIHALALADAANGWAVGSRGRLFHWDGRTWRAYSAVPTELTLHGLTLLSARTGWAVGEQGLLLRYQAP